MRYAERLQQRIEKTGSRLCVGLDPRPGDGGASFARNFLQQVIEETAPWAAAFKPNIAYFEAMGLDGLRLLEELLGSMPEDVPVILDAKRSDIGETQKYYAQGYFAGWNVDAVTLNPFLGYDSLEPFLDWKEKAVYLLAVTSNPGSADFQRQVLADGRSVFELVTALGERAKAEDRATDVGYVVGLTNAENVLAMEFLTACQALDLLKPLEPASAVKACFDLIRKTVPFAGEDRVFSRDIMAIRNLINSGEILKAANGSVGELEW